MHLLLFICVQFIQVFINLNLNLIYDVSFDHHHRHIDIFFNYNNNYNFLFNKISSYFHLPNIHLNIVIL